MYSVTVQQGQYLSPRHSSHSSIARPVHQAHQAGREQKSSDNALPTQTVGIVLFSSFHWQLYQETWLRHGDLHTSQRHSGSLAMFLPIRLVVDLVSSWKRGQRSFVSVGKTAQISWRLEQLKNLLKMMDENESLLCEALYKDLRKPKQVVGLIC